MRKTTCLITVAAALTIAGCSSGGTGQAETASQPQGSTEAAPATQAAAPTTESGRIHKNLGEDAGFANEYGPMLTFTIDDITISTECQGSGRIPGTPEGQFLNVDMTVTADSAMPIELNKALVTPYWSVVDSNGVTQTDIGTYECFKNDDSQLSNIQAGNTYELQVIFDVPTDAQALVFQANSTNAQGWEWALPA